MEYFPSNDGQQLKDRVALFQVFDTLKDIIFAFYKYGFLSIKQNLENYITRDAHWLNVLVFLLQMT